MDIELLRFSVNGGGGQTCHKLDISYSKQVHGPSEKIALQCRITLNSNMIFNNPTHKSHSNTIMCPTKHLGQSQ
jgi:uncharacterized lipoprotein YbaY